MSQQPQTLHRILIQFKLGMQFPMRGIVFGYVVDCTSKIASEPVERELSDYLAGSLTTLEVGFEYLKYIIRNLP